MRRFAQVLPLLVLLLTSAPALAQGDPTATPPFITPTPWARATPTLWDFEESNYSEPIAFGNQDSADFADTIIQTYHWLDQSNVITTIIFFIMSMMILGLLFKVIRRSKRI